MEKQSLKLNKTIKSFFVISILIVMLSIGYYLVIFNTNWKKEGGSLHEESASLQKDIEDLKNSEIFQEKGKDEQLANLEVEDETEKQFNTGDEFIIKSGKRIKVDWITVNNMYRNGPDSPLSGVIQAKINSEDGPLEESDYSRLYLTIGQETYNLSSQDPERGDYWFYTSCIKSFKEAKLHFGPNISVLLRESFFRKSLNANC